MLKIIPDSHVDKGVFFGYSSKRKAYKFYNLRLKKFVQIINVIVNETSGWKLKE